jgi:hypothetical protein
MKTTALLEAMAEVWREVTRLGSMYAHSSADVEVAREISEENARVAKDCDGDTRKSYLTHAAAWAILALHAHDGEAGRLPFPAAVCRACGVREPTVELEPGLRVCASCAPLCERVGGEARTGVLPLPSEADGRNDLRPEDGPAKPAAALPDRMPPVCSSCRGEYSSAYCEPCRNTGVTQDADARPKLAAGQRWRNESGTEIAMRRRADISAGFNLDGVYQNGAYLQFNAGERAPAGWTLVKAPQKPAAVAIGDVWRCVGIEGELVARDVNRFEYPCGLGAEVLLAHVEAPSVTVARAREADMLGLKEWTFVRAGAT